MPKPRYLPAGESALIVEFGATIDPRIHDRVLALDAAVQQAHVEGVTETVPTYRSLMIHFDPRRWAAEALAEELARLDASPKRARTRPQRWHIPACYEPPHDEDIAEAAAFLGLPRARIIDLHQAARYRVYMYGFAPGFTFLGGLPQELTIPRRAVPRAPAPPGSLLIAGGQALIASCAMPTGWYGIGRTPVKMFDSRRARVFLAGIGDEICFERIDREAFDVLSIAAEAGEFCARCERLDEF
ncbi:MAG TPA: allophanate hydrolase subunit 1 [Methylocella sp.]|nr:allophanate hydrolase subunit 1 [Methylocella sp.]